MASPSTLPMSMSAATTASSNSLVVDTRGLDQLRRSASKDPKAAVKEAARQFEGLFMQELMKGMRKSVNASGMLDNAGGQMATEMLDTQFATRMTGQPGGLGEVIQRQLERQMGIAQPGKAGAVAGSGANAANALPASARAVAAAGAAGAPSGVASATTSASTSGSPVAQRQAEFVRLHSAAAKAAESETGIPANFMVAQAAHESGWGRREIRNADGSSSFNVFGIKAGSNWSGPTATVTTTEYVDGVARKTTAKFRAYASYEESFRDYAKLMTDSPRYSAVVAKASSGNGSTASAATFAAGLQRAGYATDPAYADKLTRMINTTLRLQRAMT